MHIEKRISPVVVKIDNNKKKLKKTSEKIWRISQKVLNFASANESQDSLSRQSENWKSEMPATLFEHNDSKHKA